MNRLFDWLDERFPLRRTWKKYFSAYYVPKNLNFFYIFGVLALVVLVNQLLSGLWLTMFYTPSVDQAFSSIEYIMREIPFGWLFRYMHSTGASAFFIVIYLHMFRGLLYGSYQKPRELVWLLGMFLYVLLLASAFLGYLLPWGQMSYWGAEVITSLLDAIPYIGKSLVTWLRGGYAVGNPTLQRFFALHVSAIPWLLVLFVFLHVVALHKVGSNNPEGIDLKKNRLYRNSRGSTSRGLTTGVPVAPKNINRKQIQGDFIPFYPYYLVKDLVAVIAFLILFFSVVFWCPELGGYFLEHNNFVPANPLMTPDHITPMWYMSPFYAILRAIPDKLIGVLCMNFALLLLFLVPWLDCSPVRSMRYKGKGSQIMFALGVISFVLLGYLGTVSVTPTRLLMARIATPIYFAYFLLMPLYTRFEATRPIPLGLGVR